MSKPDESEELVEIGTEEELEAEEITEVTQLQKKMRASMAEVRQQLSGVTTIAEELRRELAATRPRRVRRRLTSPVFPAVSEDG